MDTTILAQDATPTQT
ncbi:uncharacterized protein FTOL_12934 [Fusarium torulosum]|uniref:Uncharacterized protein n=1 Tax=Fusarium torulosum TaxID=33205 RepID=A0AAE8MLQ4_9HYPO|nr:uncharacterized protein FTOL_12934 [Fusarium torulosum]